MKSYQQFSKEVDSLSSTILDCYDEVLTELKEANDRIAELEKENGRIAELEKEFYTGKRHRAFRETAR